MRGSAYQDQRTETRSGDESEEESERCCTWHSIGLEPKRQYLLCLGTIGFSMTNNSGHIEKSQRICWRPKPE
jgi:hypothetical protein